MKFEKEVASLSLFRLCREVDGKIVDLEEISARSLEEAMIEYRKRYDYRERLVG